MFTQPPRDRVKGRIQAKGGGGGGELERCKICKEGSQVGGAEQEPCLPVAY